MIPPDLLNGVRVVSLEQYIAAPYCTQILAEAGAEVIKVERPGRGDPRRAYDPTRRVGNDDISGGFASYNRGKKSVTLDISNADDRVALKRLLAECDVLVTNLRPGALARVGLSPESLRAEYSSLIICEISGFGVSGGPYEQWPAFDSVIQAMSGLSSLIGESPDDAPLLAPMSMMDLLTGVWAAMGISAALAHRALSGEGCHIDAAMYDIGAAFMERALTLQEFTDETPTRGTDSFSPVGRFRAADGRWLSIVIPTDEMWRRCCSAVGRPELVADPALDNVTKRAERMRSTIVPMLEEWALNGGLGAEEAAAVLRDAGQPVGVVQSVRDVRDCAHLAHRKMFAPLLARASAQPDRAELALPRFPLLIDGIPSAPGPVPALGEHNFAVLGGRS